MLSRSRLNEIRQFKRLRYIGHHDAVSHCVQTNLLSMRHFHHGRHGYHARAGGSLYCRRRADALSSIA